jgi:8-amino-7-oxononanoate synthase
MNKYWEDIIKKDIDTKISKDSYRKLKTVEENNGRQIVINGKILINFSSNDYLGLTNDKRILKWGYKCAELYGNGSGASRLITGTYKAFNEVESNLAVWGGKPRCLLFNSGYHANVGLLSSLADRDTVVFTDKTNHASIYDGIILSRAVMARYRHNDMDDLRRQLEKYRDAKRKILITDSVFSMDGDIANLNEIVKFAKEHNVLTIVDEAHSFGIFGDKGNGLVNELKLKSEVDIIMGTLGKSFGVFGAFVLSEESLIDYLINNCRSFIYTTALPPFVVGCVNEALRIIQAENRGSRVLNLSRQLRDLLHKENIDTLSSESQIIPIVVNENARAISLMNHLMENGFYAPAIRPPTVPENLSRIRLSVAYYHTEDDIKNLFNAVKDWFAEGKAL